MNQFSLTSYAEILALIKAQYMLIPTSKALQSGEFGQERKCILRHDIDYSLDHALNMARLESDVGITSTYYFLLDSHWHNLFNMDEKKKLKDICDLGHEIGLHFDVNNIKENGDDWKNALEEQKSILENLTDKRVESFSYHNPGTIGLEALDRSDIICDMINCYSLNLQELFDYRSDSLRRFKDADFLSALKAGTYKNLHLLIHPILWQEKHLSLDDLIGENIQAYHERLTAEWNMTKRDYKVA
jgi:hypothetical protein